MVHPNEITVPHGHGRVACCHVSADPAAPLIVYLEDVHMNYEAQVAIAAMLERLIRDYGFELVLTEGKSAWLTDDFKYLRPRGPIEARRLAADKLLREGTIAAGDYVDLTTDLEFLDVGIEDMDLYMAMTRAHVAMISKEQESSEIIGALQAVVTDLKTRVYSEEMLDFDELVSDYDADRIGLAEYAQRLRAAAAAHGIRIAPRSNAGRFLKASYSGPGIDTRLLFEELDRLVEEIRSAACATAEQKTLAAIDAWLSVLLDAVKVKLIPSQYAFMLRNRSQLDLKGWCQFLERQSAVFGLTGRIPAEASIAELSKTLPVVERFYEIAVHRRKAFIYYIDAVLRKYAKDKAVLIAGGFHTSHMRQLMTEKGYSFVVISPRLDVVKDYSALYKERAKSDLRNLIEEKQRRW